MPVGKTAMPSIYYDSKTGDLKEGVVWEADWRWGPRVNERDQVYAKCGDTPRDELYPLCFRGPDHEKEVKLNSLKVDLFGKNLGHFVEMADHGYSMASEGFAKSLRSSGLVGFVLRDVVTIAVNQSAVKDPKLLHFEVVGKGGFGHRYKLKGAPNVCPKCRRSPVICDYCGIIFDECGSCGFKLVAVAPGTEAPFLLEVSPQKTLVVANRDWDGSDIFGVHGRGGGVFFSTKAKDWFEKAHIFEVTFKRALLDMQG
jgi:hypothetical protein